MGDNSVMNRLVVTSKAPVIFEEVFESDLKNHYGDALKRMSLNQLSGVIIKGYLNSEEVGELLNRFNSIPVDEKTVTPSGSFYPEVFPEFNRRVNKDSKDYYSLSRDFFLRNQNYAESFKDRFVVNLFKKICNTFEVMSDGLTVGPPTGMFGVGSYPFGSFRCFPTNSVSLPVHCGNYFQTLFNNVYEDLNSKAVVHDQLSFFITLQKSDEGGELEVLGLNWASGMTKTDMMNDDEVILPDGQVINVKSNSEFSLVKYKPEPGDLLVFQGGSIWHRVSKVQGSKSRVTFGGFIAPAKNGESYLIWS